MPKGIKIPARIGRPCKLTPALQAAIVARILKGNFPEVAAAAEGVADATYYDWMRRGRGTSERKSDPAFVDFVKAIESARAQAETNIVSKMHAILDDELGGMSVPGVKHEENRLKCAQWFLEHGFSQKWGKRPDAVSVAATTEENGRQKVEIVYHRDVEPEPEEPPPSSDGVG